MNKAKCNVYGTCTLVDLCKMFDKREFQSADGKLSHNCTCFTLFCYPVINVWFDGAKQFSTNEMSVEVT